MSDSDRPADPESDVDCVLRQLGDRESRYWTNLQNGRVRRICGQVNALTAELAAARAENERLRAENDKVRYLLATADIPCVYCGLAKADMAKCLLGFPGCDRADDLMIEAALSPALEGNKDAE